jgi:hypothetical protein
MTLVPPIAALGPPPAGPRRGGDGRQRSPHGRRAGLRLYTNLFGAGRALLVRPEAARPGPRAGEDRII